MYKKYLTADINLSTGQQSLLFLCPHRFSHNTLY